MLALALLVIATIKNGRHYFWNRKAAPWLIPVVVIVIGVVVVDGLR